LASEGHCCRLLHATPKGSLCSWSACPIIVWVFSGEKFASIRSDAQKAIDGVGGFWTVPIDEGSD
jgi:hypothetical protein